MSKAINSNLEQYFEIVLQKADDDSKMQPNKGVHQSYKNVASQASNVMFRASIKGHKELDKDLPLHVTLKTFHNKESAPVDEIKRKVGELKIERPDPKKLKYEPIQFTSNKTGNTYYMLKLHGTPESYKQFSDHFHGQGITHDNFMAHVTITKDLYDKIQTEGLHPHEVEFSPLTIEHGANNTAHTFQDSQTIHDFAKRPTKLAASEELKGVTYKSSQKHIWESKDGDEHNDWPERHHYNNIAKAEEKPTQKHSDRIRDVANKYAESKGMKLIHNLPPLKVHSEKAGKIADAYHQMQHDPSHPEVKHSYNALINETNDQFGHLQNTGLKMSRIKPGMENPYKNSKDLHHDIQNNNHIWYYPTESGFGSGDNHSDHPMLTATHHKDTHGNKLLANDVFRIVHDYFGHGKEGYGFGAAGEENAWRHHKQMYSPTAVKALTTETRGQNSWVNFGPHSEHNRKNPANTIYAHQKAGILPDFAHNENHEEQQPTKMAASEDFNNDLQKGIVRNAAAGLMTAGMIATASPIGNSAMDHQPKAGSHQIEASSPVKHPYDRYRMLRTIAQVESTGGKNTSHAPLPEDGMHRGASAYGKYGLTPVMIKETIKLNKDLSAKHRKAMLLEGKDLHHYMDDNPELQDLVAEKHLARLEHHFGPNPSKIGYAWLNGIRGTYKAGKQNKNIDEHWHVKKIKDAYSTSGTHQASR